MNIDQEGAKKAEVNNHDNVDEKEEGHDEETSANDKAAKRKKANKLKKKK